jgi:hypothetical protein
MVIFPPPFALPTQISRSNTTILMKQYEDYISGPHRYWTHFFCGLAVGALVGWWIFEGFFDNGAYNLVAIAATGICLGAFCGRWGDSAWLRISNGLRCWFGILR